MILKHSPHVFVKMQQLTSFKCSHMKLLSFQCCQQNHRHKLRPFITFRHISLHVNKCISTEHVINSAQQLQLMRCTLFQHQARQVSVSQHVWDFFKKRCFATFFENILFKKLGHLTQFLLNFIKKKSFRNQNTQCHKPIELLFPATQKYSASQRFKIAEMPLVYVK